MSGGRAAVILGLRACLVRRRSNGTLRQTRSRLAKLAEHALGEIEPLQRLNLRLTRAGNLLSKRVELRANLATAGTGLDPTGSNSHRGERQRY